MTRKLYTIDLFIYFKDDSFFTLIMLVNIYLYFTNLKIISQDVLYHGSENKPISNSTLKQQNTMSPSSGHD